MPAWIHISVPSCVSVLVSICNPLGGSLSSSLVGLMKPGVKGLHYGEIAHLRLYSWFVYPFVFSLCALISGSTFC